MDNIIFEEGYLSSNVFEESSDLYQFGCVICTLITVKVVKEWLLIYSPADLSLKRIPGIVLQDECYPIIFRKIDLDKILSLIISIVVVNTQN